jgi:uncharacterized protein
MEIKSHDGRTMFRVRVTPRASRDQIEGEHEDGLGGALKIRVTAPPTEGRANEALRRLLAERLNVALSAVRIIAGEQSRAKRISIAGVTPEQVRSLVKPKGREGG